MKQRPARKNLSIAGFRKKIPAWIKKKPKLPRHLKLFVRSQTSIVVSFSNTNILTIQSPQTPAHWPRNAASSEGLEDKTMCWNARITAWTYLKWLLWQPVRMTTWVQKCLPVDTPSTSPSPQEKIQRWQVTLASIGCYKIHATLMIWAWPCPSLQIRCTRSRM